MVDKDRIRLLVQALRSGEYAQARNRLTAITGDGRQAHCCLGVATVVAIAGGCETVAIPAVDHISYQDVTKRLGDIEPDWSTTRLTQNVQQWFGLEGYTLLVAHPEGARVSPVHMNDSEGRDFGYIADAFERTFLPEDVGAKPLEL